MSELCSLELKLGWIDAAMGMINFDYLNHRNFDASIQCRGIPPEVFLGKGALEICCTFTGEHPLH